MTDNEVANPAKVSTTPPWACSRDARVMRSFLSVGWFACTVSRDAFIFCTALTPADFLTAFKRLEEQSRELEAAKAETMGGLGGKKTIRYMDFTQSLHPFDHEVLYLVCSATCWMPGGGNPRSNNQPIN